jgi:hypothetical protein
MNSYRKALHNIWKILLVVRSSQILLVGRGFLPLAYNQSLFLHMKVVMGRLQQNKNKEN